MNNGRPHVIETIPTLICKDSVSSNNSKLLILQADDKFFITKSGTAVVGIFFGILAVAFGFWILFGNGIENYGIWENLMTYSIMLAGVFFIIYGFTVDKTNKRLILDRLNGTISYPDLFYLPALKGKFKDLTVVISVSGDIDGMPGREYLKFVNTFKPRKLDLLRTITYEDPYEEWSFYVWYMDKNRPLPPGSAFDPYRQQDFERRKREGFPKPLYKSYIETPEFTQKQQKERERVGGW